MRQRTKLSGDDEVDLGPVTPVLILEGALRYNSGSLSGRSAARLARLLWEQEVPGSNPGAPTVMRP